MRDRRVTRSLGGRLRSSALAAAFLVPLLASSSEAQTVDWAEVHRHTIRGIDHLYNLEFDDAFAQFDETIRLAPDDPRGWFFKSMVYFYVYQLTENDTAYEKFIELSESVIDKAESILENAPDDLNAQFYLGGIFGYRGLAYQRHGNLLGALWDGRKGYGHLKTAATGERYSIDAKMGFGLFTYLVARIPRSYSWVFNLLGFSGDQEEGLRMIRAAADSGIYTRTEAALFYAQFCFFERRYAEAYVYMRRIMEAYPKNSLFLVTFAAWELRQDRIDEAIAVAERAIHLNATNGISVGDEFAHSTLAAAYYARNAFAAAIRHWLSYIDLSDSKESIGNFVYYRMGLAYEILGDRQEALATWNRMRRTDDEDEPWQSVFWRRAQTHQRTPLLSSDVVIIVGRNMVQGGRPMEAAEMFATALTLPEGNSGRQAVALYELINATFKCGEYAAIEERTQRLLRMNAGEETWVFPHALFLLGRVHAALAHPREARDAFHQALSYEDYDWELTLRDQIEREAAKLPDGL